MSFEDLRAGTVFLEPLYPGGVEGTLPGSSCIANAYTNNHDALAAKDIGTLNWVFLKLRTFSGI